MNRFQAHSAKQPMELEEPDLGLWSKNSPRIQASLGASVFFFCPSRLCRAADGHDRPDQGAESQPGYPLFGVQTVCHTDILPQGEKELFPQLSDSDRQAFFYYFTFFPLHVISKV